MKLMQVESELEVSLNYAVRYYIFLYNIKSKIHIRKLKFREEWRFTQSNRIDQHWCMNYTASV